MKQYSAQDFFNLLKDNSNIQNGRKSIVNIELNYHVKISNDRLRNGITYIFRNCIFKNSFILWNIDTSSIIEFHNCQFKGELRFDSFTSSYSSDYSNCLVFNGCTLNSLNFYSSSVINNGLSINNSEIKILQIRSLEIRDGGIQIYNSNILNHLFLSNVAARKGNLDIASGTRINSISIFDNISVNQIRLDFIGIKNCFIANLTCHSFICSIISEKSIDMKGISCEVFTISNTKIEEKLIVSVDNSLNRGIEGIENFSGKIESIDIESSTIRQGFKLNGSNRTSKSLNFRDLSNLSGSVSINALSVESLNFEGINQSVIILDDITIKNLTFRDFVNRASLFFKKINPIDNSSIITIRTTILGATYFSDVEFDKFANIIVEKTDFSEVNQSVYYIKEKNIKTDSKDNCKELREIFRQLKHASEKQGNRIQALEYQALEMKFYQEELSLNKDTKPSDRLILLAGSTNDFGQNFLKPIELLFYASLLFFPLITIAIKHPFDINKSFFGLNEAIDTLQDNIGAYFQLLNPVHNLTSIYSLDSDTTNTNLGWAQCFSFLYRIVVAFFTFQIVSAFRKYVKS